MMFFLFPFPVFVSINNHNEQHVSERRILMGPVDDNKKKMEEIQNEAAVEEKTLNEVTGG